MPISVLCSCGKTLKIDEKHRGKRAKCPACGNVVLVEETEAEEKTAVQAKAPKRKPTAADDDADPDDAPEDRKPIKRKKKKVAQGSGMLLLVGGGVLVLLLCCLSGVGGGAWYYYSDKPAAVAKAKEDKTKTDKTKTEPEPKTKTEPEPKTKTVPEPKGGGDPIVSGPQEDLNLIPDGVAGFVSVRVADGWKNNVVQELAKQMSPADMSKLNDMESRFGMKVDDLERVTVIIRSAGSGGADQPDIGFVLKTSKPMDRKKVVDTMAKGMKSNVREVNHQGGTIYVFSGASSLAFYFQTDRILLMCEKEVSVKDLLRDAKKTPRNPALTRGIQMAAAGRHTIVAAFELKKELVEHRALDEFDLRQSHNLKQANGFVLTGTLNTDLALEAILTYSSSGAAGMAKKDAETLVAKGRTEVKQQKDAPAGVVKFMDSLAVDQRSAELVVKGRLDLDPKGLGLAGKTGKKGGGPAQQRGVNNLKQIALALHSFHDVNKSLPNHAILDPKSGQPLLSWRVSILPYLGEQKLYSQIRLNESWDSVHNRQFWSKMPKLYQLPGKEAPNETYYLVVHGNESVFPRRTMPPYNDKSGITMPNITDGTSNTIGVVEAAFPVNWMRPDDVAFQINEPGLMNRIGNHWGNDTFLAAMMDGTVHSFRRNMPQNVLQAIVTRASNDKVNWGQYEAP